MRIRAVDSEPIDENDRWPSDAQILYYSSSELWKFKETINYKNLNCWLQCDRRMWMYFNAFFFFFWIWNWIFWPLIFCNKSQRCELPRFPSIFFFLWLWVRFFQILDFHFPDIYRWVPTRNHAVKKSGRPGLELRYYPINWNFLLFLNFNKKVEGSNSPFSDYGIIKKKGHTSSH